jgi:hypothetical protein
LISASRVAEVTVTSLVFGVPMMYLASSWDIAASKPSTLPVVGLSSEKRAAVWVPPTFSSPLSLILAIVEPAGTAAASAGCSAAISASIAVESALTAGAPPPPGTAASEEPPEQAAARATTAPVATRAPTRRVN